MLTAFDDAWQDGTVLDDHFGEDFVIVSRRPPPRANLRPDVNARPMWNSAPIPFAGLYQDEAASRLPASRGHASSDAQAVSAGVVHVEYAVTALPFVPCQNDLVTRVATGASYAVADPGEPVNGRRRLRLTARMPA